MRSTIQVTIDHLSDKGEGTAPFEDKIYFLDGLLPGETAEVEPGEPFVAGSKRAPARLIKLISPHPQRTEPFCRHFPACGGCTLQQAALPLQHQLKQDLIAAALQEAGADCSLLQPLDETKAGPVSRFKSIRHFALHQGRVTCGFYKKRSHELESVYDCPLEPAWMGSVSSDLCICAQHLQLRPYDERHREGALRHLLLREGDSGQRLLLLITACSMPPVFHDLMAEMCSLHGISSAFWGINDRSGNQILPEHVEQLCGSSSVFRHFAGLNFEVGPLSFLQVNYPVAESLYRRAVEHCGSGDMALDLCCGAGTMSLQLARNFKKVIGVEVVPEAVTAAAVNARLNKMDNVEFICSDMGAFLQKNRGPFAALIADPARAGLGEENCRALGRLRGPLKASFIFCSLKALKRDLRVLLDCGFRLEGVQGFDMFPHTMHVETLVLMSKPG